MTSNREGVMGEWLQSGGLLYRLTDERYPRNRDEINVAMADGSRDDAARAERAAVLLAMLTPPADTEYDRELIADALRQFAHALTSGELDGAGRYSPSALVEQADMLEAADNADAANVGTVTPPADAEQRARELLATEFERDGIDYVAGVLRLRGEQLTTAEARAVRAIVAALSQPAAKPEARGVVDEGLREKYELLRTLLRRDWREVCIGTKKYQLTLTVNPDYMDRIIAALTEARND